MVTSCGSTHDFGDITGKGERGKGRVKGGAEIKTCLFVIYTPSVAAMRQLNLTSAETNCLRNGKQMGCVHILYV